MTRPRAVVAWSSGKDSAYALHATRQLGHLDVVGVLTTLTDAHARVSMHGVREELLDRQAAGLGLPCIKVRIPSPCTNDDYDRLMGEAVLGLRERGVTHVVFGDLYLAEVRAYRESRMSPLGMSCVFPLWGRDTATLACEMVASGLRALITCVDPRSLDASFAGRELDHTLLAELPDGVDPCGENGEYHTVVVAGPMLAEPIEVERGVVVERDGFVFADVVPRGSSSRISASG